ncbi:CdaR family protein [Candidatus Omnitrophota bacterium]
MNQLKKFVSENLLLKILSLVIAVAAWIYIVGELGKGALEQQKFLEKIFPTYGMMAKNLSVRPRLVGNPRRRYRVAEDKILVVPEDCIVVGPKRTIKDIDAIYTIPIDVSNASESFTKSVPIKPIASGVYFEETVVMVTIPIEKAQ